MNQNLGCLCGCGRIQRARGLSLVCLNKYRKKITAGILNEEQLIAEGKMLPSTNRAGIRRSIKQMFARRG